MKTRVFGKMLGGGIVKYYKIGLYLEYCLYDEWVHCFGFFLNFLVEVRCGMSRDHKWEP